MNNRRTKPIHAKVIVFDETEYWVLDGEVDPCPHREWVERIECLYLFDANEHTYCCSFQPDYWMREIENRAIFKEGFWEQENAHDMADAIDNWICGAATEDGSCYMDCSDADAAFERLIQEPYRAADLGETDWITLGGYTNCTDEELDKAYEEQMQAVEEGIHCNAVI